MSTRLVRSNRTNKIFAGVLGGIARRYGINVTALRILTAIVTVCFTGIPFFIYLAAWALMPSE